MILVLNYMGWVHCITLCPKSPSVWGLSRPYLFAYCLNIYMYHTMDFVRIVIAAMRHLNWADETGHNTLFYTDLNNRRTGKDATKPRILGLLGHSV